jgi:hypothetical protein
VGIAKHSNYESTPKGKVMRFRRSALLNVQEGIKEVRKCQKAAKYVNKNPMKKSVSCPHTIHPSILPSILPSIYHDDAFMGTDSLWL